MVRVLLLLACTGLTVVPGPGGAAEPWPVRAAGPELPLERELTRIAVGSCSGQHDGLSILDTVAASGPDLFLFLGDNMYGDSGGPDVPEVRQGYADLAADPDFAAFSRGVPLLATWDDHDYGRNDAGADFEGRETSERLFETFWGDAAVGVGWPGVYGARTFGPPGRRVQVILLDTRSFRSPLAPGEPGPWVPSSDPAQELLGAAQWSWLADALRDPAEVRLVVSSIQVLADTHPFEAWDKLPAEQERLFEVLRDSGAGGVVLLSGDRHVGALYRRTGVTWYALHELTSSSLNRAFVTDTGELGTWQTGPVYTGANFGLVDVDWDGRALTLSVRGDDGSAEREVRIPFDELGIPAGGASPP